MTVTGWPLVWSIVILQVMASAAILLAESKTLPRRDWYLVGGILLVMTVITFLVLAIAGSWSVY